jgi:hypothetical protein
MPAPLLGEACQVALVEPLPLPSDRGRRRDGGGQERVEQIDGLPVGVVGHIDAQHGHDSQEHLLDLLGGIGLGRSGAEVQRIFPFQSQAAARQYRSFWAAF